MSALYRLSWIALVCLLTLSPLPVAAQVSASLSGRVLDQTGAAISGASVTATNLDTALARSTVTDKAGRYELPALPVDDMRFAPPRTALPNRYAPAFPW